MIFADAVRRAENLWPGEERPGFCLNTRCSPYSPCSPYIRSSLTTTHKVQPSPFPFRSRWPRRIDAHMAAGSCTPERRDASCSRNPPLPLRSHHAMRPRSRRERLHPPRPRTACLLPLAGAAAAIEEGARRVRCCPFPTLVPRDRPPSLLARERPAPACSPIAARLQSERRGRERACRRPRLDAHAADVLPVGSALLPNSLFHFAAFIFVILCSRRR